LRPFVAKYYGYWKDPKIKEKFHVRLKNLLDIRKELEPGY